MVRFLRPCASAALSARPPEKAGHPVTMEPFPGFMTTLCAESLDDVPTEIPFVLLDASPGLRTRCFYGNWAAHARVPNTSFAHLTANAGIWKEHRHYNVPG